jgi:glycosyltransferase involved in cell wall biosynthesis
VRPRVLLTLADVPSPADTGKRIRSRATLEALAAVADVDLLVVVDAAPPAVVSVASVTRVAAAASVSEELELPDGVRVGRRALVERQVRSRPAALARVVRRLVPWQIALHDLDRAREVVTTWHDPPYDLVWFGALDHAHELGPHVRTRRSVVDADDVETEKLRAFLRLPAGTGEATLADRMQRRVELPMWWRVQRRAVRRCDRLVVASDHSRFGGERSRVVPNAYPDPGRPARLDDPTRATPPGPPTLLVIANFEYGPNLDAAAFFVREILPLVRADEPAARLRLVGRAPERVSRLGDTPGVEVVGPVASVAPHLAAAHVAVVPVRYGSGTRLKVLEAFAHGVPVVSTALGCEGLGVTPEHVVVADDPAAFAAACVAILRDDEPARRRAQAARALYEQRFRPEAAAAAVHRIVREVL